METVIVHPILGPFVLKMEVGRGAFASVFLAMHKKLFYPVAIKVFDILDEDDETEDLIKEIDLLRTNTCPLVVDIYDTFEFEGHQCLLMEYVEGESLLQFANENGPFTEDELRYLFAQMVVAVYTIHQQRIVHRDIKCENIIVDSFRNIKLIDFGFAQKIAEDEQFLTAACGSPAYVAPEIVKNEPYDFQVDVWSLGVILYAISAGKLPFDHPNVIEIITLVATIEPDYPPTLSPMLTDLLKKMLTKDPNERITIEGVLTHPWLVSFDGMRKFEINFDILSKFSPIPREDEEIDGKLYNLLKTEKSKDDVKRELIASQPTYEALTYKIINRKKLAGRIKLSNYLFRPIQNHNLFSKNFSTDHNGGNSVLTSVVAKSIIFNKGRRSSDSARSHGTIDTMSPTDVSKRNLFQNDFY